MADYYRRYVEKLASFCSLISKHVAVLGCGRGQECAALLAAGADSIEGFDLDPRIGETCSDSRVAYHRVSIVETGAPAASFDVVYSCAVFEHVHNLRGAFEEAVRLCRPGGIVFVLSSPLWYSPYGNHLGNVLPQLPWCHLLFTPRQLRAEIERLEIDLAAAPGHMNIDDIVDRVYDPCYFNRLPVSAYLSAVETLRNINIEQNAVWPPPTAQIIAETLPKCIVRGFREEDLKAGGHFFVGRPSAFTNSR